MELWAEMLARSWISRSINAPSRLDLPHRPMARPSAGREPSLRSRRHTSNVWEPWELVRQAACRKSYLAAIACSFAGNAPVPRDSRGMLQPRSHSERLFILPKEINSQVSFCPTTTVGEHGNYPVLFCQYEWQTELKERCKNRVINAGVFQVGVIGSVAKLTE
jgi:hypothetical protein